MNNKYSAILQIPSAPYISYSPTSDSSYYKVTGPEVFLFRLKEDERYSRISVNLKACFLPDRPSLIVLLNQWREKFAVAERTYFLSIHLMDDVMSHLAFPHTRLHLGALCCFLLACNSFINISKICRT